MTGIQYVRFGGISQAVGYVEDDMTLAEAAKVLGVDPGTLRVQIHNGKLKARKVGPIWTVTPKEVERYSRENRRT